MTKFGTLCCLTELDTTLTVAAEASIPSKVNLDQREVFDSRVETGRREGGNTSFDNINADVADTRIN